MNILKSIASLILFVLSSCSTNYPISFNKHIREISNEIIVESIKMEPKKKNSNDSELSVYMTFTNHGQQIHHWKFGFYMPCVSFYKIIGKEKNYNKNLIMEICDEKESCSSLHYEKSIDIKSNDLSQGYTTILSPTQNFPLLRGKTYTIKLMNNNKWGGGNTTYFPQNLFLVILKDKREKELKKIYKILTRPENYEMIKYNQKNIDKDIKHHLEKNWNNSIDFHPSYKKKFIIPHPVEIKKLRDKDFLIKNNIHIYNQFSSNNKIATMIAEAIKEDIRIETTINNKKDILSGIIIEKLDNASVIQNNPEGYVLTINSNNILIQAIHEAGVYYAFQTLRQLWNNNISENKLPPISIIDYPKFKYRGMLLDTARHFFKVKDIKFLIDLMGVHKLNTLHLHLSDDEAFRIEIPYYPTLKTIGSVRGLGLLIGPTMLPQGNLYKTYNNITYPHVDTINKGVYTKEDIKEIINYANLNQITVIPEIDIPAHSRALVKALPEVFFDPNDHSIFLSDQGYTDNVLPVCTYNTNISVGPDFTKTINNIIKIIADLFNGQTTLHALENELSIGGDEVSPNAWTNDSSCQGKWNNLSALQKSHMFFKRMALLNPKIIFSGWQQFVQTNGPELGIDIISADRTGHAWVWNTSEEGVYQSISLANHGYKTVLAFSDKTYFDLAYTPDINEPGLNWGTPYGDTHAALSSAISANKVIKGLHSWASKNNIVGLEGALWSENVMNFHQMVYMLVPKMAGLAEASWTSRKITLKIDKINWKSLAIRLGDGKNGFLHYLSKIFGIRYRGFPNGIKSELPNNFNSL